MHSIYCRAAVEVANSISSRAVEIARSISCRAIEVASSSFKSLRRGCGRRDPHLHRAVAIFIFFEPLRSSSSRRRNFHLLRAIALIFIAPSRFSSFSSHCAHLHRAVAIFIFFEPSR
jgi:hypothetical protein